MTGAWPSSQGAGLQDSLSCPQLGSAPRRTVAAQLLLTWRGSAGASLHPHFWGYFRECAQREDLGGLLRENISRTFAPTDE